MKYIISFVLAVVLLCCSYDKSERANSEIVYVCSGASAKRYHKSENC